MSNDFIERAQELDRTDSLAVFRNKFHLPGGTIYLDGNSLGPMPKGVAERVTHTACKEWAQDLITSWNKADWVNLPRRISAKIARLIGTDADCVAVTDSTSVNLFKVLSAALAMRPDRIKIVSERDNFPTDLYMAEGLSALMGKGHEIILVDDPEDVENHLDDQTAVLMLTHVNYKSGRVHDMAGLTAKAHSVGALAIWDLAHSAGALEVNLDAANTDFAVGCGYKYLNGGPGAPAFLYVNRRHHEQAQQPLTGWFSHSSPFTFDPQYAPASGITQFYTGTPPVLSLTALEAAIDVWEGVSMADVWGKSLALTDLFIEAVETQCDGLGLTLTSPREHKMRGSQVSFRIADIGYPVMQALISRGVIGDFRAPDVIRFGFTPLYTRFVDVARAAGILAEILQNREWDTDQFKQHAAVT